MADITDDFGRVNSVNSADLESLAKALKSAVGQAVKYMSEQSKETSDLNKKIEELSDSLEKLGDDIKENVKSTKKFVDRVVKAADDIGKQKEGRKSGLEEIKSTQKEHTKVLAAILRSQQKAMSAKVAKYTTGSASLGAASKRTNLADMGFKPKGTDRVPAMLSPGEFIVNKKGAKGNERVLDSINKGYRLGGKVKPAYLRRGSPAGPTGTRPLGGGVPVEYGDVNGIFSEAGQEAADAFSDRFDRSMRQKMARWATGVANLLMGGPSFTQVLFSGAVRDATEFRVEMRELAFQTQGITGDLRDLQAEFANLGNSIVSETGKSVDVLQKVYIKNLKKGFQDNKAGLKVMKSGLYLSTMIGSEAEQTADMFGEWHRTLRLSSEQMDTMAFNMKEVARNTGITGDELVGAMKSSEGLLKNLRNQGNLTTSSAKALIEIMAEAKKSGTEESTGRIMDVLTSTNKLLDADSKTKSFVYSMAGAMGKGATDKALSGTLMESRADRAGFADQMMVMFKKFSNGAINSLEDFDKLDATQKRNLTLMLRSKGLEIDQAKELYKQLKKSSAPMKDRISELDQIANSKFATDEEKKLAKRKKDDIYLSKGMDSLSKLREKSSKMGLDKAFEELAKDKNFTEELNQDFPEMYGALTDSMKRQFGLSGTEKQVKSQMSNMDMGQKFQLSGLISAQKTAELAKEKGIEYKDFSQEMSKAIQNKDSKAFGEAYDSFIAERKKLDTQLEADTDPTKALAKSMTELNETIRKYTSSLVGGFIDLVGPLGLLAFQIALLTTSMYQTFGKDVFGKLLGGMTLGNLAGRFDKFAGSVASSDKVKDGMFKKFFQTYQNARTPSTDSRMMDIAEFRKLRRQGMSPIDAKRHVEKMGGFSKGKGVMSSLMDSFKGLGDDIIRGFKGAFKSTKLFFSSFLTGFRRSLKVSGNFFSAMSKGLTRAMRSGESTRKVLGFVAANMSKLKTAFQGLRKTAPGLHKFLWNSFNLGKSFTTMKFASIPMHFAKAMKSGFALFKGGFSSFLSVFKAGGIKGLFGAAKGLISGGLKGARAALLGGTLGTAQIIFSAIDMVFGAVSGFMNTGKNFAGVMKAMGKSTKDMTWGMYASSTVAGALVGILDGLTFGLLSMTGATKWLNETLSLVFYTVFSVVEGIIEGIMVPFQMVWSAIKYLGAQFKSIGDSVLEVFNAIAGIFGAKAGNWSEAFAMLYPWLKRVGMVIGIIVGGPLMGFLWLLVKGISLALVPIQMFVNAIAGIVKIFAGVIQFVKDIFTVGILKAFWNLGSTILSAIYGVFKPVVDFFGSLVTDIMAPFKWLYNILVGNSIIPDLCTAIVGFFGKMAMKVLGFVAGLPVRLFKGLYNTFFKAPAKLFTRVFKFLGSKTLKSGISMMSGKFASFFEMFKGNLSGMTKFFGQSWYTFLNTASGGMFGKIVSAIKGSGMLKIVDDFLIKPIAKGLSWLGSKASEAFSWLGKQAKQVFGPAVNWLKTQVGKVMPAAKAGAEATKNLAKKAVEKGAAKVAQMAPGATKAMQSARDLASKGVSKAKDVATGAVGVGKKALSTAAGGGKKALDLASGAGKKALAAATGGADDLAKSAPAALGFLGKSSKMIGGLAKKLPVVGPLLDFGIRKVSGQSTGKAVAGTAAGAAGGLGGAALGAAIGTMIFPGVGTAIGGLLGGVLGGVGAGMASDAAYDKVVGTGSGNAVKTAEKTASEKMAKKSAAVSTPVGEHAVPALRPEESPTAGVQPVHLRDITGSILRDRAGSGGNKLQSDELARMEETSNRQVEELEQIREGIREMVSLLKPKAGGIVGDDSGNGPGRTRDPRRPLHAANFGKMKYGKMGGNANRSLINNGES